MSQMALTYSRREWVIELLLLLAQGLLVWMVADQLFAPFTSNPDPLPLWLPVGLVISQAYCHVSCTTTASGIAASAWSSLGAVLL